jgi:hypothetical protein
MRQTPKTFAVFGLAFFLSGMAAVGRAGDLAVAPVSSATSAPRPEVPNSWKLSLAPVLAGQALDASSSWGMRELNPVLAGPDGRFGMKSATVKLGVTGALIGVEYLILKAHPRAARMLTKLNWAAGIASGGIAAHNFAIR